MRIDGSFKAEVIDFGLSYTKSSKVRMVNLKVAMLCDKDQAEKLFDEDLISLAFGSMRMVGGGEGDTGSKHAEFAYKSLEPDIVCEQHAMDLAEHAALKLQPIVTKIEPAGKGEPKVKIQMKLPISVGENVELLGKLGHLFRKIIDVKLEATQQTMPLVITKAGAFGNPELVPSSGAEAGEEQA